MSLGRRTARRRLAAALVAAVVAIVVPVAADGGAKYDMSGPWSRVLKKGPYRSLPFQRVMLTSKVDGVAIEVGFWRPKVKTGVKVPVIAVVSPYFTGINPTDTTDMSSLPDPVRPHFENFLSHGYAIAGVSVRGSGYSGGCIELFGPREVADIRTAMDWLGKAPWSNGRIGVTGVSYDGAGAWEAAASGSRYVRTIVPAEGFVNAKEDFFRGGKTSLGGVSGQVAYLVWPARRVDPARGPGEIVARVTESACPEFAEHIATTAISNPLGGVDPLGYWAERNHKPAIERGYRGSILLSVGMRDDEPLPHQVIPWADRLDRYGITVRQWIGAWNHSYPDGRYYDYHRWDWAEYLLHWFDHELKGVRSYDLGPRVQVMDNARQWRYEDHFPPREVRTRTLRPDGGGSLADRTTRPASYQLVPLLSQWPYRHNNLEPNPLEEGVRAAGQDGAVFDLRPPRSGLRFSGVPLLSVSVTPQGPTGAVSAYLYDVAPDGAETELTWAMKSVEYRNGGDVPELVVPGSTVDMTMPFQPTDAVIRPGHRLRLRVWQLAPMTSFDPRAFPMTLHVGPGTKTALSIPTIVRDRSRVFDPADSSGLVQ